MQHCLPQPKVQYAVAGVRTQGRVLVLAECLGAGSGIDTCTCLRLWPSRCWLEGWERETAAQPHTLTRMGK